MAGIPSEGLGDDFFEQMLAVPPSYGGAGGGDMVSLPMGLQLGSGGGGGGNGGGMGMPLGLNLEQGFLRQERFREEVDGGHNSNSNNNASSSSTASSGITVKISFSLTLILHLFDKYFNPNAFLITSSIVFCDFALFGNEVFTL